MKNRVSLTLSPELLGKIDGLVKSGKADNRSEAVENLLQKSLTPTLRKAVILAGGKGLKMRPLTYEVPKALFPIAGKTLLEHTLDLLREAKIQEVILCIGYLGEKIIKHCGDGERFGLHLEYSQEEESLGTGGALKRAEPFFKGERILVIHGDILTYFSIPQLISFHEEQQTMATIAIKPRPFSSKYGKVLMTGAKITDFFDRPTFQGVSLVNTGIYVLEPEVLSLIPEGKPVFLEHEIFPKLAREEHLSGYPFQGPWFDISTPKSYEEAIKRWIKERG